MLWPVAMLGGLAGGVALWPWGVVPGLLAGALLDRHLSVHDLEDLRERLGGCDELQVDALLLLHLMGWLLADVEVNEAVRERHWMILQDEAKIAGLPVDLARRAWRAGVQRPRLRQLQREVAGRPLRRDYLVRLGWRLLWLADCPDAGRARLEQVASLLAMPEGRLAELERVMLERGRIKPYSNQSWLEALEVLGMPLESSAVDLQRAYRRLLARWHPDRHHVHGMERVALATERTRQIRDAWLVIQQRLARSGQRV